MLRASVRNTFLTVEVAEERCQESPQSRRSRSGAPTRFLESSSATAQESDVFFHLDALINSTCERPAKLSKEERRLLSIRSNSSVSTMASEDWDVEDGMVGRDIDKSNRSDGMRGSRPRLPETPEGYSSCAGSTAAPEDWSCAASTASCEGERFSTRGFQHCLVPRSQKFIVESTEASEAPLTTLMIRNVPNRYSQDELIDELERLGFVGSFDFFYTPIDVGTMANVGYAFVNFVDPTWAARCQDVLEGYVFAKHQKPSRERVAKVSVAHLQGLEANLQHYEQSAVSRKARSKRSGPVVMPVAGGLFCGEF